MKIELTDSDDYEQHEDGWRATVVAWADDASEAEHDQTIDGSRWEACEGCAYAALIVSGPGEYDADAHADAIADLVARLEADGYDVDDRTGL